MNRYQQRLLWRGCALALGLGLQTASAASANATQRWTADELEQRLAQPAQPTPGASGEGFARTRAFRPVPPPGPDGRCEPPAPAGPATRQLAVVPLGGDEQPSVDLALHFDFNSDRLAGADRQQLDELANAMNRPSLRAQRFTIAGHTDAVGPPELNLRLSCARGLAVRAHLLSRGVAAERLGVYGFGASQPRGEGDAMDRRVEIRRATP